MDDASRRDQGVGLVNSTLSLCAISLSEAGFMVAPLSLGGMEGLAFEDAVVVGFAFAYDSPDKLVASWSEDSNRVIASHQLPLRRAGQKAWNTYIVLLAESPGDHLSLPALAAIEEDLVGTRKIARAGVAVHEDVRAALLPLLPIQSAPTLESVDMIREIQQRTTEIRSRAVEAFLSSADESVVLQTLEEPE